jgi:CRISPR-associated endonuclease Csy4
MKSYIDITLMPNADIALYFLWEKIYQQVHLALVGIKDANDRVKVGASFPDYSSGASQNHMGGKLRLLASSSTELEELNIQESLSRFRDYMHITGIRDVPDKIQAHAFFKRVQSKNNNDRLARRKAKRDGISLQQALAHYADRKEQYSTAPYIRAKSLSSGDRYRLMVAKVDSEIEQNDGGFNTYGLSATSTVPIF